MNLSNFHFGLYGEDDQSKFAVNMSRRIKKNTGEQSQMATVSKMSTANSRSLEGNMSRRAKKSSDGKSSMTTLSKMGAPTKGSNETAADKQKNQNVKQFLHKMREKAGMVEKTEYPKELEDSFRKFDEYKLSVDSLAEAICDFIQMNPNMRKVGDPEMKLAAPEGQDEYEMVGKWLKDQHDDFKDYKKYTEVTEFFMKMNTLHREYQFRARRALHNIRTFLKNDYWIAANARQELGQQREAMDFARSEMKGAKNPELIAQKAKLLEQAESDYQDKLKQVQKLMADLPKHRDLHVSDLLDWCSAVRQFHEKASKLISTSDL